LLAEEYDVGALCFGGVYGVDDLLGIGGKVAYMIVLLGNGDFHNPVLAITSGNNLWG
jgi:hypothetical protein